MTSPQPGCSAATEVGSSERGWLFIRAPPLKSLCYKKHVHRGGDDRFSPGAGEVVREAPRERPLPSVRVAFLGQKKREKAEPGRPSREKGWLV